LRLAGVTTLRLAAHAALNQLREAASAVSRVSVTPATRKCVTSASCKSVFLAGILLCSSPHAAFGQDVPPPIPTDRWQVELSSSENLYEVKPLRLRGDTLILQQGDSTVAVPLARLSVLRRIRKSAERPTRAVAGSEDEVYQMSLFTVPERRTALDSLLRSLAAEKPEPPRD